jgi:hypothetical protein
VLNVTEWWICFGEFAPKKSWWHIFTRPGWRHVFAIGYSNGQWIILDPMSHRLDVVAMNGDQLDDVIAGIKLMGGRFLRMQSKRIHYFRAWEPLYCVSVVKHLLGINGFAWTPEQLYRLMKKHGAVAAYE